MPSNSAAVKNGVLPNSVMLASNGVPSIRLAKARASRRFDLCPEWQRSAQLTKDQKGQEQPTDKETVQKAGVKEQNDAAEGTPESPGEPIGGE